MLGGSVGLGGQGGLAVGRDVVPEPSEPGDPGVLLVGQVEPHVEAGGKALVRPEPAVVGPVRSAGIDGLVGVSEDGGDVAGPPGCSGHVVETEVEGSPVPHHAVVELVRAGVETRPARTARSGLAVVPGQTDPLPRQPVEIGGPHDGVPGRGQTVAAELVERDEEHVHRCDAGPQLSMQTPVANTPGTFKR